MDGSDTRTTMKISEVWIQVAATCSASLVFFSAGCSVGWSSTTLPRMVSGDVEPNLTSDEASWITGFPSLGMIIITIPAGYMADLVGRKITMLFIAVPYVISWALISVAQSASMLYAARIIGGLGAGISFTVAPMYTGEIAQEHIRGALGIILQLMYTLGLLFEYSVGPYVSPMLLGILSALPSVVFFGIFIWMPESPYYYLLKNRRIDAEYSLLKLRGKTESAHVEKELLEIEEYINDNLRNKGRIKDLIFDRACRKAMLIVVGLIIVQNLSGINAINSYSTLIFEESSSSFDAHISVIITGIVQVVLCLVSLGLVDVAGRRIMLMISCIGCILILAVEGCYYYLQTLPDSDMSSLNWLPATALVVFFVVYTLGLGPLPLIMQGELLPSNMKGISSSICCISISLASMTVIKLFQITEDAFGVQDVFWFFALSSVIGFLFIAVFVPETKGKTFMQISKDLAREVSWRQLFLPCLKNRLLTPLSCEVIAMDTFIHHKQKVPGFNSKSLRSGIWSEGIRNC